LDSKTEQEIVAGLRAGHREAWLRLYDTYAQLLWRRVGQLVGSESADVADVVQETFLAAARSTGRFDPQRGSLWMWLWGIARRQIALHYRRLAVKGRLARSQRWWQSLDGAKADWIDGKTAAPPEVLEAEELALLVRAALLQLPPDYQMLLLSKYVHGEPSQRIAEQLHFSDDAVRSKLARARKAFRKVFNKLTRSAPKEQEVRP